jgi:hypothetical protein
MFYRTLHVDKETQTTVNFHSVRFTNLISTQLIFKMLYQINGDICYVIQDVQR